MSDHDMSDEPLLVDGMRRWPRGEVRHIPGGGIGMSGTSTEGFLREYDEAITEAELRGAKIAAVWVVLEYRRDRPQEKHLYGVFLSEDAARADYGELRDPYLIEVIKCRTSPPTARGAS